jgi:hypothetical protein
MCNPSTTPRNQTSYIENFVFITKKASRGFATTIIWSFQLSAMSVEVIITKDEFQISSSTKISTTRLIVIPGLP